MTVPVVPPRPLNPSHLRPSYRRWAHVLLWVPVGLAVGGMGLSFIMLAIADSSVDNAALGYLALVLWGVLLVASPLLIASFVFGIVMLSKSSNARAAQAAYGGPPPEAI
jgi:hypothetical protein